jgi:hypothetical protein
MFGVFGELEARSNDRISARVSLPVKSLTSTGTARRLSGSRTRMATSSKKRVSDSFEPFRLELRPEVVESRVRRWRVFTGVAQRRDRGPVGGCADEDLVNDLCIDVSAVGEVQRNFLVKPVDEEIKRLVLMDSTVCLLIGVHILSKQTF